MPTPQTVQKTLNPAFPQTSRFFPSIHKQLIHSTTHSNCGEVDSRLGKKPEKTVTYLE